MKLQPELLAPWVSTALSSPDDAWLLDKLIPAQGLTFIAGRAKLSKKSWLAYLSAMSISSGITTGALRPSGANGVLYLNLEGATKPTAQRFPMLANGHGIPLDSCTNFYMQHGSPFLLDNTDHVKAVGEFILENNIKAVFIDTFARSFLGDENNARDVGAAMRGVEKLISLGAAVVLIHHLRKEQGGTAVNFDPDTGLRGSSALSGAYDSLLSLKNIPNEEGNGYDLWMLAGGKIHDFEAYELTWQIDSNKASLTMDGPGDLPEPPPQQKVRF